ncbi:hypothetical protein GWI33_013992 [Rhynchophorus ferrugineus]|uniref:Uncharacterized protein n=1 Tax=Rhynchophorus ferrugineus TaxID=354439 RepID=A0A834I5Z3_RHYFE|nr:hypothetical protein GWI33_013992 [Rhynchophorus ferrugineus]
MPHPLPLRARSLPSPTSVYGDPLVPAPSVRRRRRIKKLFLPEQDDGPIVPRPREALCRARDQWGVAVRESDARFIRQPPSIPHPLCPSVARSISAISNVERAFGPLPTAPVEKFTHVTITDRYNLIYRVGVCVD